MHPRTEEALVDSSRQSDMDWLLNVQRKLYQWSREHLDESYRDLWNWITDLRNLRCAWRRVASNKGKRTAGVDGETVAKIRRDKGEVEFLQELRRTLRNSSYKPSPCRRKMIPKRGKPGEFRPLGIPTVTDRVVQSAIKQVLEPIFEAQFWPVSYGFRPGRGCHGALEHIRMAMTPRARTARGLRVRPPYSWVIEGDIKGCFDHINHHALMTRLRQRVSDRKVTRLVLRFLKAGILAEDQFIRTSAGTPQGGILSPLLANIALSAVEEHYERWVYKKSTGKKGAQTDRRRAAANARRYDRRTGRLVCFPIRDADDFVVLVHGSREQADAEKDALAEHLRQTLGLELSAEKTRVTPITESFEFLGHRVRLKWKSYHGYHASVEIPKAKAKDLRYRVKRLTGRSMTRLSLAQLLKRLNPILRGWGYFYRHCWGACEVFGQIDHYTGMRLWRWLRKKHRGRGAKRLLARYLRWTKIGHRKVLRDEGAEQFFIGRISTKTYRLAWMSPPDYAKTSGEPDA